MEIYVLIGAGILFVVNRRFLSSRIFQRVLVAVILSAFASLIADRVFGVDVFLRVVFCMVLPLWISLSDSADKDRNGSQVSLRTPPDA